MYSGNRSRVIPIIIILLVIAVAVAAMISLGRAIFGGSGTGTTANVGRETLLNTAPTNAVRMTARGPIVADENFRSYQITVDQNGRSMTAYSGYLDQVIDGQQLPNNQQAYTEFVYALDKLGMMSGAALEGERDDTRGLCPNGRVYEYEVLSGGTTMKRLWTTTCQNASGSLRGSASALEDLFNKQIPDAKKLRNSVKF